MNCSAMLRSSTVTNRDYYSGQETVFCSWSRRKNSAVALPLRWILEWPEAAEEWQPCNHEKPPVPSSFSKRWTEPHRDTDSFPNHACTHTPESGDGHFGGSGKCITVCPVSKSQLQNLTVFRDSTSCPLGKIRASYPNPAEDDLALFIDFLAVLEHSSWLLRELQLPHHLWGSHRLQEHIEYFFSFSFFPRTIQPTNLQSLFSE